jgi:hypothetical protein
LDFSRGDRPSKEVQKLMMQQPELYNKDKNILSPLLEQSSYIKQASRLARQEEFQQ